ncbi:thioredoxin fold domain-containing protein [Bordetella pseudohinzii]|uniref:thioredoxin fold domain-containing protein n=1 Tax=Bordetella pseudohinzii TaxID=1331258 RepID=UPI001428B2AC|nr:thioredoxin fold domain-containing protein [Bordetella pseudohinzii]
MSLGNYCRLYREGSELRARFTDRDDVIVERFPTEALAENALGVASEALSAQIPERRVKNARWKRWLPWIVSPIILLAVLEGLYLYLASAEEPGSMPPAVGNATKQQELRPATPSPQSATPARAQREPVLEPAKLAQLLGDAVAKGRYSVPYAAHGDQSGRQTLYVFSDPNCIYCRRFDSQLKTLGEKYTVHLFPVSVVGEESSLRIGEQVLCMPPAERTAWWEKALQGVVMPAGEASEACRQAVGDNDQVFRALQFRGTPTILNGLGQEVPEWIPHTAEALDAWMQSGRGQ